jgi:hypothetical protein
MRTPQYGRISVAEFEHHAARARRLYRPAEAEERIAVWRLLTDFPAHRDRITARATAADAARGDDGEDFSHLWPPRTVAERDERRELAEHIRASAPPLDDDEEYEQMLALHWPPGQS